MGNKYLYPSRENSPPREKGAIKNSRRKRGSESSSLFAKVSRRRIVSPVGIIIANANPSMQKSGVERTQRAAYIARSTSCHADRNRFNCNCQASLSGALRRYPRNRRIYVDTAERIHSVTLAPIKLPKFFTPLSRIQKLVRINSAFLG